MLQFLSKANNVKKPIIIALIVLIFALATFVRIDFLVSVDKHGVSHDSINYDIMVRQLLEKGVYAYKDTQPNAQVTPGYPIFMAAVYKLVDYKNNDPYPYIRSIQVFFSIITLWLVYLIAKRLGGQTVAIVAAFLGAIYPPFVWSNATILTEPLATLFLMAFVYFQLITFEKKTRTFAILSGAAMGLLVLTRPEFLVLIFATYAFYFIWKKEKMQTFKLLLFTLIGTAVILSPWVMRNVVTLHKVVVASTQVNPFYAGTFPYKKYDDGMVDLKGKTQMEAAKERLKVGFTQHPWKFTKWYTVGKLRYTYEKMFFGTGHKPLYPVIPLYILPWNAYHLTLIILSVVALGAFIWRWKQPAALLAVIFAVMSLTRLAFVPEYRYNYTVMPLVIIMDSLLIIAIIRWIYRRTRKEASSSL